MNAVIGKEPVVAQLLAGVVAFLAAKFFPELNLSDTQALAIAGGIIVVLTPFTRQLVTPTAKDAERTRVSRGSRTENSNVLEEVYAPRGGVIGKPEGDQIPFEPDRGYVPPPPDPGKPSIGR